MKWQSRKLVLGFVLIAVGVALELLSPRGLTEIMAAFLGAVGAAYFAGNIAEHKATASKEANTAIDIEAIANSLSDALGSFRNEMAEQGQVLAQQNAEMQEKMTTLMNANSYIIQRAFGGEAPQATGS